MAKTDPINTANPAGDSDPKHGDDAIRALARAVAEILGIDHYIGASSPHNEDAAGEHARVMFKAVLASDPDPGTGKMAAYTKTVGGRTECVIQNEDDNVIDMTSGDNLKHTSLSNNAYPPVAMITPYGGSSAPSGWLLCNDQAVSRTTYAALFAVIGTTYGVGDGSTTFNVPDFRGRVPVGLDAANVNLAAADAMGEEGGEEDHTLTAAESGVPAHSHVMQMSTYTAGSSYPLGGVDSAGTDKSTDDNSAAAASAGHNNLQPYSTVNYIIKT